MTEEQKPRGRLTLLLIAAVFFGPLLVATWMYYSGSLQPEGPEPDVTAAGSSSPQPRVGLRR